MGRRRRQEVEGCGTNARWQGLGAISALVPSRTKRQCHTRWYHVLDPNIALTNGRTGKWAEDEVTKLKDAVITHGGKNWKKIAALVPDRTINQRCKKWKDMEPDRSTVREKESSTLKKAPACVQDPHLTHDEFMALVTSTRYSIIYGTKMMNLL
jgi:hypothetical protein